MINKLFVVNHQKDLIKVIPMKQSKFRKSRRFKKIILYLKQSLYSLVVCNMNNQMTIKKMIILQYNLKMIILYNAQT